MYNINKKYSYYIKNKEEYNNLLSSIDSILTSNDRDKIVKELIYFFLSNSYVSNMNQDAVDGEDYIEVSKNANSKLGKLLALTHMTKFNTPIGTFNSIKTFMEFITTPDYPIDLISKTKITMNDIKRIPNIKRNVKYYWALVAVALYFRIEKDEELQSLLAENKLDYTSHSLNTTGELFGTKITMKVPNKTISKYLALLRYFTIVIQSKQSTGIALEYLEYIVKAITVIELTNISYKDIVNDINKLDTINIQEITKDVNIFESLPFIVYKNLSIMI